MDIKPRNIIDAIKNVTPFQQDGVAKNYENIPVDWEVYFTSIFHKEDKRIGLMFAPDRNTYSPWIYCTVNSEDYPEIKVMKKGQKIFISGKIEKANERSIYLKSCKLKFKKDKSYNKKDTIIQVKNPQLHFGKGDNVGGDKIEKDENQKETYPRSIEEGKKSWFSMENPIIWIISSLIVFALFYYFFGK